ncbi:MAG: hypothetical protein KGI67_06475 [Pseudomonadota bacterium]|nr:hypothetical protein [Pseudomonadota bacterium]
MSTRSWKGAPLGAQNARPFQSRTSSTRRACSGWGVAGSPAAGSGPAANSRAMQTPMRSIDTRNRTLGVARSWPFTAPGLAAS